MLLSSLTCLLSFIIKFIKTALHIDVKGLKDINFMLLDIKFMFIHWNKFGYNLKILSEFIILFY